MSVKESLLASRHKFRTKKVELPADLAPLLNGEGEALFVREMTETDSGSLEAGRYTVRRLANGQVETDFDISADRRRMLVRCLCDAKGERLFADDDAAALGNIPRQLADFLYDQARQVNGLLPAEADETPRKRELEKNSATTAGASPAA